jgi:preprotein translocase subunit SecD
MTRIEEMLRDADPVRHEPLRADDRSRMRDRLQAAIAGPPAQEHRVAGRRAFLAAGIVTLVAAGVVGSRLWSAAPTLHAAAVRFEIRLAEATPTLDLQPAHVAGSDRVVYLHRDAIVTNDDIANARVVAGNGADQYHVAVTLTPAAGERMRTATAAHIGRPVALLIDGEVVMAPTVRSVITTEALLTGNYTKDEAARIANGMLLR